MLHHHVFFGCSNAVFLFERREVVCGVNIAFFIVFSGRYGIFTIIESLENDVNCKNPVEKCERSSSQFHEDWRKWILLPLKQMTNEGNLFSENS